MDFKLLLPWDLSKKGGEAAGDLPMGRGGRADRTGELKGAL